MAEFPALPFWTDAYLADCGHLSDAEHGVYLQILIAMWRSPDCRIPNDDEWLSRRFKRDANAVRTHMRPIIQEFCTVSGKWITQKRLSAEMQYVKDKSKKNRRAANLRWNNENDESERICETDAGGQCERNAPTPTPTPTPPKAAAARSSPPPEADAPPQSSKAAPAALQTDWFEVTRDALIAAGMSEQKAMNETGTGQAWAHQGYTPELILSAIREVAKRPGYTPPRSLSYFKSAIADRHGIATVKSADPIVKPKEPINWIAKAKAMDREEWYFVLKAWKNRDFKPDAWKADRYGPMPGQPGCLVNPEALLIVPVPNLQAA